MKFFTLFLTNFLKNKYFICFTGKGKQRWKKSGALYDGDWENDMMNGHGTLSLPFQNNGYRKVYEGSWRNNKKHVHILIATHYEWLFISYIIL